MGWKATASVRYLFPKQFILAEVGECVCLPDPFVILFHPACFHWCQVYYTPKESDNRFFRRIDDDDVWGSAIQILGWWLTSEKCC